ncbi:MAG: transcriptional regulator, partial [Rhodoferax sp.]|nr:transcriptional regulator [Rhodoferax sp.]
MGAALLTPVLQTFANEHPGLSVRVFDNSIHEIPELVESRSAAFGVTVALALRGELIQEKIAEEPFMLACRREHPLAGKPEVRWQDLAGETLIRIALPFDNSLTIDDAIGPMREQLRWRFETQRHALAMQMVREGAGLAVLPRLHVSPADELVTIPMVEPRVNRTLVLVTRRGDTLSGPEARLRDMVLVRIHERLADLR